MAGDQTGRAPRLPPSPMQGAQPPDMASRSHGNRRIRPLDFTDPGAREHLDPGRPHLFGDGRERVARLDHRRQFDPRGQKIQRRRPAAVGGGEHHGLPAGRRRVTVEIGRDGARHHHARTVIAVEHQRPLDRAGRQDGSPRDDLPKPLARLVGRRRRGGLADLFQGAVFLAVIDPEHRCAPEQTHAERRQLRHRLAHPLDRRLAVDLLALAKQAPAHHRVFISDDHPQPRPRGDQGRRQTGRSSADHQDITEGVGAIVVVRVRGPRKLAEARRPPDHRLVQPLPQLGRPHEGLVVEAGHEQRGRQLIHRHHVEGQAGPAVLAMRLKAFVQRHGRGACVGIRVDARADGHQRIRLLASGGQDAARPVVLERTADQTHVVGEKGRGQGVARESAQPASVERERQRFGAVNEATVREPAHGAQLRASDAPKISWLTVSRSTTSQLRQPWA